MTSGCYNQRNPIEPDLPFQTLPTEKACSSLLLPSADYYDWRRKSKQSFVICATAARKDGFQVTK